jgi:6-phosphogluconate dehydrogenase (decarboxylating)
MELFNKTAQAIILDRMFFSTSMVPNMKFLEEKAEDQDMASIKHSLNIALNKYLDINVTNYYEALVIVQKQDIRSVIINTLTEEFRALIELDTFKSVIERSSFPTSEILLSYVNEMQQFAHVIHKTLIEEFTSLQKESDDIKLLLQKAISNTLNEKIKQEGSILKVIDLKSRLLSIGF